MFEIETATEIDAPAGVVWKIVTDLTEFPAWNPFIRHARGTPALGATIHLGVRSSLGVRLSFHATVVAAALDRELRWVGHVLAPWLARGDHTFAIEPVSDSRVHFVQREVFSGILARVARRMIAREARHGFEAMNLALKARAETSVSGARTAA